LSPTRKACEIILKVIIEYCTTIDQPKVDELFHHLDYTHKVTLLQLKIFTVEGFSRFLHCCIAGFQIKDGIIQQVPIPSSDQLVAACISWRNSNQTGIIDDLRRHLQELYRCEFWAFGYGRLEDFLTQNKFTVLEIKTKVVFPPAGVGKKEKIEEGNNDESECIICMESERNCVVSECGHYCMCIDCAVLLDKCPVCRVVFAKEHLIRVFVT